MHTVIAVLMQFKLYRGSITESSKHTLIPRSDLVKLLVHDIAVYYGYTEFLCRNLFELFQSPVEAVEFFEANEVPRPLTIRTNTLKIRRKLLAQKLIARGVNLEPLDFGGDGGGGGRDSGGGGRLDGGIGLQVFDSTVPISATPEYLAGYYMLQAAASMLPVIALNPQACETERVLDMCAAPGGKSTHIAALMKGQGLLWSNDSNKERTKALTANIHRLGLLQFTYYF